MGDPSAFWILFAGAATLAVGNGMIEVTEQLKSFASCIVGSEELEPDNEEFQTAVRLLTEKLDDYGLG